MKELTYDVLQLIIEHLKHDKITLLSCILLNRNLSRIAISLLWESPYMIDQNINNYQLALLVRTYISCFTDIEKSYLRDKCVYIRHYRNPIFDYPCFIKELLYSDPIHDSILYWILLEYRNYTKTQLNNIINVHQYNEVQLQPLINSLYYMFFAKGKLKSLGISVNTLKIKNLTDYQFFNNLKIANNSLNTLTIYLKDNDVKELNASFKFLCGIVSIYYNHIKLIRIFNLLVFNNQQKSLPEIQNIINNQRYLQKLYLMTPEQNIVINKILSSFRFYNQNWLIELELQGTDLSNNKRLEGLAGINSLKSLGLCNCKGISISNINILSKSLIRLKFLKFVDNNFPLGFIISTIGKTLFKLKTNQLDKEATSIITVNCIESLFELEINVNTIIQELFYKLIAISKIIFLNVKCCKFSSTHVVNNIARYLPKNLKHLIIFTTIELKLINEICSIIDCSSTMEILEIYSADNCNNLMSIIDYFNSNKNLHSKFELSLILDEFNSGLKVIKYSSKLRLT